MVTWFKSIYIQVDHDHVHCELALGFKILVILKCQCVFRSSTCLRVHCRHHL